jgi:hypothetical protein
MTERKLTANKGIDWDRVEGLGERSDYAIAARMGVAPSLVQRQRKLRGIPAYARPPLQASDSIDWTNRFWSKVHPEALSGCWLWHGSVNKDGYGTAGGRGARTTAHRLALAWAIGPLPPGMVVRHKCDVPACVNPDHLLLGTHADNMKDCVDRGRKPRGEACSYSKLTDAQRAEARRRALAGEAIPDLAREYGVSHSTLRVVGLPRRKRDQSGPNHWRAKRRAAETAITAALRLDRSAHEAEQREWMEIMGTKERDDDR